MTQDLIRNFCIIAHIDHGKSTLADRMLELTGTVNDRVLQAQHLDTMDIERERGITIKLQPARMQYRGFELNLIDTPGHVDFTYEVSRSLAAVEGAVLLVDATQGIQAQTLANLYLALEQNLAIIPVVNKIDSPQADVPRVTGEIVKLLGCKPSEIIAISAKTGQNVDAVLDAVTRIPPPQGKRTDHARALIFDSSFDDYRGVIAYVRVVDGQLKAGDQLEFSATLARSQAVEVGQFIPNLTKTNALTVGQIGYVVTGLKEVAHCRVGDTIRLSGSGATPLAGYKHVKPVVFVGLYPREGDDYPTLRDALDRLQLNDAALQFTPEHSPALGFGFRCGFLGLLHFEVTQERVAREYGLELLVTSPSVAYQVRTTDGEELVVRNPWDLPTSDRLAEVREPWVNVDVVTPKEHLGAVLQLCADRRGEYLTTEYLDERAVVHQRLPLQQILVDFYDRLKSVTAGYASMNYELFEYRPAEVVRLDVLVAEEVVEALSSIVYRDEAASRGRRIVETLKETMPRQQFVLKLQAAVGGKVVAAERLSAMRKDVTAKLYGGDVTRKRKLLEKQKKGKARMAEAGKGRVVIPNEALLKVLRKN